MELQDDSDVSQFVSVTGTDSELAKYFLMENGGNLERALNMYFMNQSVQDADIVLVEDEEQSDQGGHNLERETEDQESPDIILLDEDDESEVQGAYPGGSSVCDVGLSLECTFSDLEADIEGDTEQDVSVNWSAQDSSTSTDALQIKLICWNIDGLDAQNFRERTAAVISHLKRESPEIIFLQEVIPESLAVIREHFHSNYHIFPGGNMAYFTSMLLKKKDFVLKTVMVEPFRHSNMLRNLIIAKVVFHGLSLTLLTSHLESMASNSTERQQQLKTVFQKMIEVEPGTISIFGGDTNIRDSEVAAVKSGLNDIQDVWEALQSPPEKRFTWDTSQNDNLQMRGRCPRLRFDRIYFYRCDKNHEILPTEFDLIGKERLACGRFISDHWGIRCVFKVSESLSSASSSGT